MSALFHQSERFEFFQLARWLTLYPGRASITEHSEPPRVRYRGDSSLSFPIGEVISLIDNREQNQLEVVSPVFGLFGAAGTLSHHDLEFVSGRTADPNVIEFLDFFNDRWLRLLLEVWKKHRPDICLENELVRYRKTATPEQRHQPTADSYTQVQLALAGFLRQPGAPIRSLVPATGYATLNSYLARPVRSGSAIERVLSHSLKVPVQLKQFCPRKLQIPENLRTRLGVSSATQSSLSASPQAYNSLGRNTVLAPTTVEFHSRFELLVGPLDPGQFAAFCPFDSSRNLFYRMEEMTRALVGIGFEFGIRLLVKRESVTPTCIGQSRLGYNSWIGDVHNKADRSDPFFNRRWETELK